MSSVSIQYKKHHEDSPSPIINYATNNYELCVHKIDENKDTLVIYTGVSLQVEPGFLCLLLASQKVCQYGLLLYSSVKVLHKDDSDEIMAVFLKTSKFKELPKIGDPILKVIPQKEYKINFTESLELPEKDEPTLELSAC